MAGGRILIFVTLLRLGACSLRLNDLCSTFDSRLGRCVAAESCSLIGRIQQLAPHLRSSADSFLLMHSECGSQGHRGEQLFCCPILANEEKCGTNTIANRIHGGTETEFGEHPWAVQLVYKLGGNRYQSPCSGVLISDRYVLTAAHCIESVPSSWKLVHVLVAKWGPDECVTIEEDRVCSQRYEIEQTIVHSSFDKDSISLPNDIALLKLKEAVQYGKYIRPVCLPLERSIRSLPVDKEEFTVVGWGQTDDGTKSKQLMQVVLTGKPIQDCRRVFNPRKLSITDMQLCVGGEEGKDSCRGDSGGPLMRQVRGVWYLVGVVSFGELQCGHKDHPSVYTNVAEYVDWIEDCVAESQ
ncbi:hypothetical protein pipiens_016439 [Culex pipiens pipiens]|uniref:CLIP domain-containing serine protease n=1 Tax=Culex pipiens pipiens TaxID=38569 RepID=A0ABD1CM90_CULPP